MKMIEVFCCVFPDGTTFWTDEVEDGPSKAVSAWRSTLTEEQKTALTEAGATIGVVVVRMPVEAYHTITTNNGPMVMAYMQSEQEECLHHGEEWRECTRCNPPSEQGEGE